MSDQLKAIQGQYNQLAARLVAATRLMERTRMEIEIVHQQMGQLEGQMQQLAPAAPQKPTIVKP